MEWGEALARLTRFYGGTAKTWFEETPIGTVTAYLKMITRLQAEESFLVTARIGVGGGHLTPADSKKIRDGWHRESGQTVAVERAAKPTPADLESMGIQVVRVRKEPA